MASLIIAVLTMWWVFLAMHRDARCNRKRDILAGSKERGEAFHAWAAKQDAQAEAILRPFAAIEDSPQQSPDAMLDLYHSLSGQALCSSVLYPPPKDAPPEEWAAWRERSMAEIKKHSHLKPETSSSLVDAFMALRSPTRTLCACASCGRRRPDSSKYVSIQVFFFFNLS